MNTPQPMNMRDGTVVSEKMEPVVPALVCRDVKVTKRRFSPSNGGTFTSAGSEIRIPISFQGVLDNKNVNLNFNVNTTATGNGSASVPGSIDFSPAGFFSQIRVEAGTGSSIVLESIDDPAVWANMLYQYTWTHEDMAVQSCKQRSTGNQPGPARLEVALQTSSAAQGSAPFAVVAAKLAIAAQEAGLLDKTGAPLSSSDIDVALDLSLFMGLFSGSSGIPLYDTAGLTLVLTLNTAANAYVTNVAATPSVFTISQVFVTASCLEGGEGYEKKLRELKNSGNKEISIMYNTCRRYIQSQAATVAQTQGSYLINERSKSCLGFVAVARDTTNITATNAFSNSNSTFPTVGIPAPIFQYNIAGMSYPVASIATKSEAIDEAYDLYSQLSRRQNSGGLLSRTQAGGGFIGDITSANTQLAATASPTGPAQVLAINLSKCGPNENFWGKGMNMSGNNLSTYLQVQYTPWQAQTINIYSIFQMKLHIDALGNMSTEF